MKEKHNKPIPLDNRTANDIRRELREQFNWDLAAMARNYRRPIEEMAELIRLGGEETREREDRQRRLSSYDVAFVPIVNVKAEAADPRHPTEEEIEVIVENATRAVADRFSEKINGENLLSVTLYEEDVLKGPLDRPVSIFDASPSPKRFLLACVNESHKLVSASLHDTRDVAVAQMRLEYEQELADPGSPDENETDPGHDGCSIDAENGTAVIDINDEWGYWWTVTEIQA